MDDMTEVDAHVLFGRNEAGRSKECVRRPSDRTATVSGLSG